VCIDDTGTVGENGAQPCLVVILGQQGKIENSCVCW